MLKPNCTWDGDKNFEFEIIGYADSECAKCPDTHKSVGGSAVALNGSVALDKSKKASMVTLSVTEAELVQAASTAQDMLFVMDIVESLGLKVKKPM